MLTEDKRKQLDDIVGKMTQNGESEDSISFVVNDFKNKYSIQEPDKTFLEKTAGVLDAVFGGGKIGEAIGTKIASMSKAGKELKQQEAQGIAPQGTFAETFKQPTKGQLAGSALQSGALFIPAGAGAKAITTGAKALGVKAGASALGKIGAGAGAGYVFDIASNLQQGKTGAQALPAGFGAVIGGAIPAAGVAKNVIVRFGDKQAPRIINSLIKPLQKDFAYGKNPGRAVAEEGIVANNFDELITKIRDSRQAIGQSIGTLSESLSTAPIISIRNSLSPLDDAIKVAASQNNQTLISRLNNVKRTLTEVLEPAFDDAGNITIKSVGSRDLENLTFKQVRNVLGDVGDLTQFTGNPSDDKLVNMALKQVYGKIKGESLNAAKQINPQLAGEFEKLTEKYADLTSAEIAAKYRDKIIERQNLIGLSPQTAGIASGLLTAVATGGAAIPTIAVGISGAVLEKLASTPGFKTRLAYLLSNKTQREASYLFRKIPALNKFFTLKAGATPGDVILSEVKKTLDEAKTIPNKQGGFVRIGKETPKTVEKEIKLVRAGDIKGEGVGKGGLFFSDSKDAVSKLNLDDRKVSNFTIKDVPDNQKYVATSQYQAVDDFLPEGRLKEYFKMLSVEGYTPEQFMGDKIGRRKFFDAFDRELSRKGIDTWTHDGKRKLMELIDSKIKQGAEKKGIKLIQYTDPDEVSFFAEAGKRNDYVVLDKSIIKTNSQPTQSLPKSKVNESVSSLNDTTLIKEAKKYKSAEEFVKVELEKNSFVTKKPITVYRGEGKGIGNETLVSGRYYADSEKFASNFGEVTKAEIPEGTKIFDLDTIKNGSKLFNDSTLVNPEKLTNTLLDNGFEYTKNTNSRGIEYVKLRRYASSESALNDATFFNRNYKDYGNMVDKFKTKQGFANQVIRDADKAWKDAGYPTDRTGKMNAPAFKILTEFYDEVKKGRKPSSYRTKEIYDDTLEQIWKEANKTSLKNNKQAGFVNLGIDEIANRKPSSGEKLMAQGLAIVGGLGAFNKILSDQMTRTEEKAYREGLVNSPEMQTSEIKLQSYVPEKYKPVVVEATKGLRVRPEEIAALIQTENSAWDETFVNPKGTDTGLGQHNAATYEDINKLYKQKYGKSYNRKNGEENIKATALWVDHLLTREGINNIDDAIKAYRIGVDGLRAVRKGKGTARFTEQQLRDMANDKLASYKEALQG